MTVPDVPDWSGWHSDLSVSRVVWSDTSIPLGTFGPIIDVSAFHALIIYAQLIGANGYQTGQVRAIWYAAGIAIGSDEVGTYDGTPTASPEGVLFWTIPCRADQVQFAYLDGPAADPMSLYVIGTTRSGLGEVLQCNQGVSARIPINTGIVPLNTGQTANYYIGPYTETLTLMLQSYSGQQDLFVNAKGYELNTQISVPVISTAQQPGVSTQYTVPVTHVPLQVSVTGVGSSNGTYALSALVN